VYTCVCVRVCVCQRYDVGCLMYMCVYLSVCLPMRESVCVCLMHDVCHVSVCLPVRECVCV